LWFAESRACAGGLDSTATTTVAIPLTMAHLVKRLI
jgi:hypothetical protein